MALELSQEYRLRWMDFDRYGRIQPVSVLDIFQDIATTHADMLGIGRDQMVAQGVFWAVVRSKFEIANAPAKREVVQVRTWPHALTRFSILRDFTMCDAVGTLLVKATTEWVLMDLESRKFVSVKDHYRGSTDFCETGAFEQKLRKIANFEAGNRPVVTIVPRYSDIDVNGHVNNARYATFVVDALDPDERGSIKTFQIDYRHEVLPDVPLAMHTLAEDGRVLSKGLNPNGEIAFASLIELA